MVVGLRIQQTRGSESEQRERKQVGRRYRSIDCAMITQWLR